MPTAMERHVKILGILYIVVGGFGRRRRTDYVRGVRRHCRKGLTQVELLSSRRDSWPRGHWTNPFNVRLPGLPHSTGANLGCTICAKSCAVSADLAKFVF